MSFQPILNDLADINSAQMPIDGFLDALEQTLLPGEKLVTHKVNYDSDIIHIVTYRSVGSGDRYSIYKMFTMGPGWYVSREFQNMEVQEAIHNLLNNVGL